MTQFNIWVEIIEMYHLVLFHNCIIIKATITWIRTTVFPPSNA